MSRVKSIILVATLALVAAGAYVGSGRFAPTDAYAAHVHAGPDYTACYNNPSPANCDTLIPDYNSQCLLNNQFGSVDQATHSNASGQIILKAVGYDASSGCRVTWTVSTNLNPDPNAHLIIATVQRDKNYGRNNSQWDGQTTSRGNVIGSGQQIASGLLYCYFNYNAGDTCHERFQGAVDSSGQTPWTAWHDGAYS